MSHGKDGFEDGMVCVRVRDREREREIMHISIKESNRLCKSVGRICMTHVIYT